MKKIGEYLIENKICDESSLSNALKEQSDLKEKGVTKPLGSILTESSSVSFKDLDKALSKMHIDILSKSTLFQDISKESIESTVSQAEYKVVPENSIIFTQDEEADAFFIVISGKIKIYRTSNDDRESFIGYLSSSEGFGEVSLLTGEPHSASAVAVEATSLLVLSKKDFDELCSLHSDMSMAFIKGFASRLIQKDAEILKASEKEHAYQQFVSQQDELSLPELIGQARSINRLRKQIAETSENNQPTLIQGETGTEKLVVAGTIHKNSPRPSTPFLSMDAEDVAIEGYGAIPEADSGSLQLELAQSSVLFGYEEGTFSFSKARGLGLLQICRQGTVVIENIDKLTKGVQEKLYSYLKDGTFKTISGQRSITSEARIIATTAVDLQKLAEGNLFDSQLLELLLSNSMMVPPIKKRKSDLRLLVDFIIIMECFKTPDRKLIKGISPEAYQRIMEYDWPGNMDELQIVIHRAINLAQGEYLMPEDIFIGIAPPKGKYTINLFKFDQIKSFFKSGFYPIGLQVITAAVFSLIFIMAFLGNRSPDHNISVLLVWAMWHPMLAVSWLVGARIWCSFCPMGAVNELLNRVGTKKFKVPAFIRNHGVYISALGLGVIIWAEVATRMPYSPMATGILLLTILSFAIVSGIFFERRVWCRYLCRLGQLGAIFAGSSIVEWRSNSSICNSTCKDNSCYKGDESTRGCPLYQGTFSLHSNHNCILCGNCVKTCPNDSPTFNLRMPGHELWAALKPEKLTTVFVPVILGTQLFRGLEHTSFVHTLAVNTHSIWLLYGLILSAGIGISYGFIQVAGNISFGPLKNQNVKAAELFTHAIIPLSFAFELAYQLKRLLTRLGSFFPVLGRQIGVDFEWLSITASPGIVLFWQVAFILLGISVSMGFLKKLIKNHQEVPENGSRYKRLRYVPIFFLGSVYIWMFLVM
jgi:DNA-binding NtrC family response regulator/NAD-dependent dihydropyrimidine dehydrogenase PreA subunit